MIKTRTSLVESLTDFIKKNHPYEVCEVITLPVSIVKQSEKFYFSSIRCYPNLNRRNPVGAKDTSVFVLKI